MSDAPREYLYHLLQLAAHRLKGVANRAALSAGGITAAQAAALYVIREQPSAAQSVVARQLGQQESAVTAMMARLLDAGFVSRAPDEQDRRSYVLSLTERGRSALDAVHGQLDQLNARICEVASPEDVAATLRTLRAIALITDGD